VFCYDCREAALHCSRCVIRRNTQPAAGEAARWRRFVARRCRAYSDDFSSSSCGPKRTTLPRWLLQPTRHPRAHARASRRGRCPRPTKQNVSSLAREREIPRQHKLRDCFDRGVGRSWRGEFRSREAMACAESDWPLSVHMSIRYVGSAHAPTHGAGLAPRDEASFAAFFIRARTRVRVGAGNARAPRHHLRVRTCPRPILTIRTDDSLQKRLKGPQRLPRIYGIDPSAARDHINSSGSRRATTESTE